MKITLLVPILSSAVVGALLCAREFKRRLTYLYKSRYSTRKAAGGTGNLSLTRESPSLVR